MLNRLYILVGTLIIVVLVAAFALPSLVSWQHYRGNIEQAATQFLGQPVSLSGAAEFRLLPFPRFEFLDVQVGQTSAPLAAVGQMHINLDLIDFLQNKYTVKDLVLSEATLTLSLDQQGRFTKIFFPQDRALADHVLIEKISLQNSRLYVRDARDSTGYQLEQINGVARIGDLRESFGFQGYGTLYDTNYAIWFSSDVTDENNIWPVRLTAQPVRGQEANTDQNAGFNLAGQIVFSDEGPLFEGTFKWVGAPLLSSVDPSGKGTDNGINVSTFSQVEAQMRITFDAVTLKELKWWPDRNRQTAFFQGEAHITLGRHGHFVLDIGTQFIDLETPAPKSNRAASLVTAINRFAELQLPIIAAQGQVRLKADRIRMDGADMRDVELSVQHDKIWRIDKASFALPGDNVIAYTYTPDSLIYRSPRQAGRLAPLNGDFALSIGKLDALARAFGKTEISPFLLSVQGLYSAQIRHQGPLLVIQNGRLNFGETSGALDVRYDFLREGNPNIKLHFSNIDSNGIETLLALMPDINELNPARFAFKTGVIDVQIDQGNWAGLDIEELAFLASWAPEKIQIERLEAKKFGQINARIGANLGSGFGENQTVTFNVEAKDWVGLSFLNTRLKDFPALYEMLGPMIALNQIRYLFDHSQLKKDAGLVPLKIETGIISLDKNGQTKTLTLVGDMAGTTIEKLKFDVIRPAASSHSDQFTIKGTARLKNQDGNGLLTWFGIPGFVPKSSAQLDIDFEGDLSGDLAINASLNAQHYRLILSKGKWQSGNAVADEDEGVIVQAKLDYQFADSAQVMSAILGVDASSVLLNGTSTLVWRRHTNGSSLSLNDIKATLDQKLIRGNYVLESAGKQDGFSAEIVLERADISDIAAALFGASARHRSNAVWPIGQLALLARGSADQSGTLSLKIDSLALTEAQIVRDAELDFALEQGVLVLKKFSGDVDGGTVQFVAEICCVGSADTVSLKGSVELEKIPLQNFIFEPLESTQKGFVSVKGQFATLGNSIDALVQSLSGQGTVTFEQLEIVGVHEKGFEKARALDDVASQELGDLTQLVARQFDATMMKVEKIEADFDIIRGVARINQFQTEADDIQMDGEASLNIKDLKLEGQFDIRPKADEASEAVDMAFEPVKAVLFGASVKPKTAFDFSHFAQSLKQFVLDAKIKKLEQNQAAQEQIPEAATTP